MNEKHENDVAVAEQPKKAWHAPVLEETTYAATEAGGAPSPAYDGPGTYSVA